MARASEALAASRQPPPGEQSRGNQDAITIRLMRHHWHSASDALSLFLLVNTPFLLVKTPVVTLKTIIPFSVSSAPKCAFKRETARDAPSGANDSPSFRIWFTEIVHWLHESTGAEIETALCILESVLPTLVSTRYYTRKLDLGICGSLLLRPATQEGSSETRKLGIWNLGFHLPWTEEGASETRKLGNWNLGVPWARTQEGCSSETRKLGIWNLGVPPDRTQEGASETRKLGIWNLQRVSWNLHTRNLGIWNLRSGVSRNLYIWNVGII